jgi:hypothetical protein
MLDDRSVDHLRMPGSIDLKVEGGPCLISHL